MIKVWVPGRATGWSKLSQKTKWQGIFYNPKRRRLCTRPPWRVQTEIKVFCSTLWWFWQGFKSLISVQVMYGTVNLKRLILYENPLFSISIAGMRSGAIVKKVVQINQFICTSHWILPNFLSQRKMQLGTSGLLKLPTWNKLEAGVHLFAWKKKAWVRKVAPLTWHFWNT